MKKTAGKHKSLRNRLTAMDWVIFAILTLFFLAIALPFYNTIMISLVTQREYLQTPFILIPKTASLMSYKTLIKTGSIWVGYRNTLINLGLGLPISLILVFITGYTLARPKFPLKRFIVVFILITMLFSGGTVPMYLVLREMKLLNSRWSVILTGLVSTYYSILVMSYIRTLPDSLLESARLDGAGEAVILFRVVLPLSTPILATMALFFAVDKWNEWYGSMLYLSRAELSPLQLILRNIVNTFQLANKDNVSAEALAQLEASFSLGVKNAAVVLTMLPIMLVYPFLQKYFVKGITIGAVKG